MKHVVAMEFIVESDEDIMPEEALLAAKARVSDYQASKLPTSSHEVRRTFKPSGWDDEHPDEEFVPVVTMATCKTVHLLVTNLPEGER